MSEILKALYDAAAMALSKSMNVAKSDKVTVIYDCSTENIAAAFESAAKDSGFDLTLRKIEPTGRNGADPDPETCAVISSFDVVIAITKFSLTHCAAIRKAREAGKIRGASLPGITDDLFARSMCVDPEVLCKYASMWMNRYSAGTHKVRVTNEAGTDISFTIGSLPMKNDCAMFHEPGLFGNIPGGEVFTAPDPGTAEGRIVIDGSIGSFDDMEKMPWPFAVIDVRGGRAVEFISPRAKALEEILEMSGENAFVLAEFGIGTNPGLSLSGNLLEDEKVKGTIHFAFGNNRSFGGTNEAHVHIDGMILSPTLEIDGVVVIEKGEWKESCLR